MKNFKLETIQLSKKADMKIKMKIYFLSFKRDIKYVFSLSFLTFAIPALVFGIAVFGLFQSIDTGDTLPNDLVAHKNIKVKQLVDSTISSKYRNIARNRARVRKAERYKTFAMVRSAKVRKR